MGPVRPDHNVKMSLAPRTHPVLAAGLTAALSLGMLALAVRFGWLGADVDRGAEFCEAAAGRVRQPVNTLSNLGFVVAGLAIAREAGRLPGVGTAYACLVVLLGPASMAMHATESALGGHLDMLSMYLLATFAVAYAAMRLWRGGPRFARAVFVGCLLGCAVVESAGGELPVVMHAGNLACCSSSRWCSNGGSSGVARSSSTGGGSWEPSAACCSPSRSGARPRTVHRCAGRARSTRGTVCGTCCARSRRTACSASTQVGPETVRSRVDPGWTLGWWSTSCSP